MRMKKKGWARILTALLIVAVTVGFIPQMAVPAYADDGSAAIQLVTDGNAPNIQGAQASSVWFGNYMQSSADTKDPVKWRVLQNAEGELFLLSDQNLDCKEYNEEYTSVTWETSTIRTWLNGDFKNAAFSTKEADAVVETEVVNAENPEYLTPGGNTTTDEVFLLSIGEATNTAYGFTDNYSSTDTRVALNTKYAKTQGAYTYSNGAGYWWLRSPGGDDDGAAYVDLNGNVICFGSSVDSFNVAVRPAFNLNLESVLFTSAAEGGKSSGDGALNQVGTTSGNEWKLTLKDTDRGFAVTGSKAAENGVTVEYTGAESGDNEYISAVIKNNEGNITYYGRIAKVSDAGTSGSVTINTAGKLGDGDTLYVFNEQYNGEKKTDYASDICAVDTNSDPQPAAQTITASNVTKTYGNASFSLGAKTNGDGTLTYKSGNAKVATVSSDGKVTIKGAGTAKITISASATANYKAASKTITVTVNKAANPLKISAKTATVKYSKLKTKAQTLAVTKVIKFTKKLNDKKTYTLVSAKKGSKSFKKYFKINKTTGKVTIKKNSKMKKGTYKVKVKVRAAGNTNYKASKEKTVTFTVKVK